MKHYSYKKKFKIIILLGAICIGAFSSLYTKSLVDELKVEEEKKIELWSGNWNRELKYLLIENQGEPH